MGLIPPPSLTDDPQLVNINCFRPPLEFLRNYGTDLCVIDGGAV